jgi:hypothetical protein
MAVERKIDAYDHFLMQNIKAKNSIKFDQDVYSMTYLMLMKENVKKFEIPIGKSRHHISVLLLISFVQVSMLTTMACEIVDTDVKPDFKKPINYMVTLVRFMCTITLHLKLVPDFTKGMKLMNYCNNNPEQFVDSYKAFLIGFLQVFITLIVEIQNLYNLMSYTTV